MTTGQEDERVSRTKPRRPWLAFVATLVAAPVGHIYAGAPLRGLVAVAIAGAVGLVVLLLSVHVEGAAALLSLMGLLVVAYLGVPVDAYVVARRSGRTYHLKAYNRWFVYVGLVVTLSLVSGPARNGFRRMVQAYKIPSGAMVPTLQIGDHVLTDKTAYHGHPPKRFDVVVFEFPKDPEKMFVKRVIGLPGDTIEIMNGKVWINGSELSEPYAYHSEGEGGSRGSPGEYMGPKQIPEGSYFMMGDNRDQSYDSRFWGPVSGSKIWGRVRIIYFSWAAGSPHVRWGRIGMVVR